MGPPKVVPGDGDAEAPDTGAEKAVSSSSSLATRLGQSLTAAQVRLRANKQFRKVVVAVTVFAVFVDILGTCLIIPSLASLCAYADGGPVDTIMAMPISSVEKAVYIQQKISPYAFKGEKGAWQGRPPVGFSLSMNLVMSGGLFGSAFGSLFFGRMCDTIGAKLPMQLCLFMGIFGYLLIYAAGVWVGSYYLFVLGMLWNNFFGNTVQVATVYFGQLFEGAERDLYVGIVMGMMMLGGTVGGLVVMPFVLSPENGENFFGAVWLAIGLTVFAFLLVTFVLVPPENTEKEKVEDVTPALAKRILVITIIASAVDSAGDEGTRMARGTIMTALFPQWSTIARQNYLLIAMIAVAIFAAIILGLLKQKLKIGLPAIGIIGTTATLATQLALMAPDLQDGPYIAIWHGGKLFGFLSTFCTGFLVQEIAPKSLLGYWNGRNEAATNIAQAISPLIFASVYDGVGNTRGTEMLAATASISFLAVICFVPLLKIVPKPDPAEQKKEFKVEELDVYEQMSDAEWNALPLEVSDIVNEKFLEAGRMPKMVSWGDYQEERPSLVGLQDRALADFKYVNRTMMKMLTNREELLKNQKMFKQFQDMLPKIDRDKAKQEMGAWLADYFDDAGYVNWEVQSTIYKSMVMSAFPPVDPLDDIKPDFGTMPVERFEDNATKFLAVMDNHLAIEQRRVNTAGGTGILDTLLRRR